MFCISISGRFAAGLPYIYPTNGRGNYTPLFNQPIDSRTSVGNPIATAGSVRVNLNRSFQDQQSTPNWTPSQVGVSLPSAAQSNFTEITFGIPRGIPQPGFQAFSGNQRLAAYRARYGVPQFAPPLLPSALPAQAPRLPTAEGTSARQPIGAWLQDAAQSQVAPALGQHPVLFQLPPAGPHDSTAVSSTSSESNPDDRLDGVSGVENLAEVLGGPKTRTGMRTTSMKRTRLMPLRTMTWPMTRLRNCLLFHQTPLFDLLCLTSCRLPEQPRWRPLFLKANSIRHSHCSVSA
jgi:hypothetical protein